MNINIEAFNDLIASVERRPEKRFDMRTWRCGTTCCAWGSFVEEHGEKYGVRLTERAADIVAYSQRVAFEHQGALSFDGYEVASKVLGIPYDDAGLLFSPSENYDKPAVLARLRRYLRLRQYLAEHSAAVGN